MALQNITSGDSNPGSVTPNGITPENALNKLRRRADGPPRQETFFSIDDQPTKNWAYAVFVKVHMQNAKGPGTEWTDWVTDWIKPNHFRSSEGAQRQLVIQSVHSVPGPFAFCM